MSSILAALSALVAQRAPKYTVIINHPYDRGISDADLDDSIQVQVMNLAGTVMKQGLKPRALVGTVTPQNVSARCVVKLADDEAAAVLLGKIQESACEHMVVRVFPEDRSWERMGS